MEEKQPLALSQKNLYIFTAAMGILLIASVVIFGLRILGLLLVSYAVALAFELLFAKGRDKPIDRGWMVSPLVLVLILPPTAPYWLAGVASGFGILFGKMIFGGTGRNIFNPAAVGYLFALISFPQQMATTWLDPVTDVIASATPLIDLNMGNFSYTAQELMIGFVPGTIGETFRIGIIVIGIALAILKVIDWRIPLTYIGAVFALTGLGYLIMPDDFVSPFYSLITGGLLFGAFFMATDPHTSPHHPWAKVMYGFGLAFITVLIRNFSAFPEGVIFAIIIMNAIGTLFDAYFESEEEAPQVEAGGSA